MYHGARFRLVMALALAASSSACIASTDTDDDTADEQTEAAEQAVFAKFATVYFQKKCQQPYDYEDGGVWVYNETKYTRRLRLRWFYGGESDTYDFDVAPGWFHMNRSYPNDLKRVELYKFKSTAHFTVHKIPSVCRD